MDLTLLLVADYASATVDGKLNIIGVFQQILAVNFPATHAEMYLVMQLGADASEAGKEFTLDIRVIDEDGEYLARFSLDSTVPPIEKGRRIIVNNIVKLIGVKFPKPGFYVFRIVLNKELEETLRIEVIHVDPQV